MLKLSPEISMEGELLMLSELCRSSRQAEFIKRFLILLTKTDPPEILKCSLLRIKCLFGLMLLWLIIICFPLQTLLSTVVNLSYLYLS